MIVRNHRACIYTLTPAGVKISSPQSQDQSGSASIRSPAPIRKSHEKIDICRRQSEWGSNHFFAFADKPAYIRANWRSLMF
jgi:hypothetical protein